MGEIAAKILLDRLEGQEDWPKQVAVKPELMVRESTTKAAS
jgi:DNA-binding LacI/PurR family transcriptional regulator